jgi:hypothetical protein
VWFDEFGGSGDYTAISPEFQFDDELMVWHIRIEQTFTLERGKTYMYYDIHSTDEFILYIETLMKVAEFNYKSSKSKDDHVIYKLTPFDCIEDDFKKIGCYFEMFPDPECSKLVLKSLLQLSKTIKSVGSFKKDRTE